MRTGPGWTETRRLRILVLRQAIHWEKSAVLTEERGEDATDLWARAREWRHEAGQDPEVMAAAPGHIRATVRTWRGDFLKISA